MQSDLHFLCIMTRNTTRQIIRNAFKYIIPLCISIGLCYLLFTGVDFDQMIAQIAGQGSRLSWILLTLTIAVFSHIFRAMRWGIQLKALGIDTPLSTLIDSIFGTYAVNLVLPRLGEVWRTGFISQRQKAPFTQVFGSMVAERCIDTITVLTLTLVTFLLASDKIIAFVSQYPTAYNFMVTVISSPWTWILAATMCVAVWFIFSHFTHIKIISKLKNIFAGLWQGFAAIAIMKGKVKWLLLTILIWGCYFTQLYIAFHAFDFTTAALDSHGIIIVLVCFVLSSIAMGIPSNGGIGPWQVAVMFGLSMYGLTNTTETLAFANFVLGTQTLLLILLGLYTFAHITLTKKIVPIK